MLNNSDPDYRMPPLQGIYYFYVAAKLGSFKSASTALFVTAAAVSQQIRALEEWLGTELFVRQHRKVELTQAGHALFKQAKKGFDHIYDGISQIRQDPDPTRLSISTLPSFTQHWLVPRVKDFHDQFPELALLIEPRDELVLFQQSPIDLCIRYGTGNYPDIESHWLMDDMLYPVCHPSYQKELNLHSIQDLHRADLINDLWPDMDWKSWIDNVGAKCGGNYTFAYDGTNYVLEGALSAQGVALARHTLAHRYIQEGTLVRIDNVAVKPSYSYYLCAPSSYFEREKVKHFRQWIRDEVELFQQSIPREIKVLCGAANCIK